MGKGNAHVHGNGNLDFFHLFNFFPSFYTYIHIPFFSYLKQGGKDWAAVGGVLLLVYLCLFVWVPSVPEFGVQFGVRSEFFGHCALSV